MKLLERRQHRIFVYGRPVDMRNGFGGLEALIRRQLDEDPLSGDLFVFMNRRGTLLKCFLWDRTGYVIIAKRLERGKFRLRNTGQKLVLDEQRFALLFDGIEVGAMKFQPANKALPEGTSVEPVKNCQALGPRATAGARLENALSTVEE